MQRKTAVLYTFNFYLRAEIVELSAKIEMQIVAIIQDHGEENGDTTVQKKTVSCLRDFVKSPKNCVDSFCSDSEIPEKRVSYGKFLHDVAKTKGAVPVAQNSNFIKHVAEV